MNLYGLRTSKRGIAALTLLIAALVAQSCGGGDKPDDTPIATASAASTPVAVRTSPAGSSGTNADELIDSAIDATLATTAYKMTFVLSIAGGGSVTQFSGDMSYRSPTDIYVEMEVSGLSFDMLALPPDVYIRERGGEWFYIPEDAHPDLRALSEGQDISEYADLLSNLENVEVLSPQTISGVALTHLRGTFDLETYAQSLPPGQVDEETLASIEFVEPATFDILINKETSLIARMDMKFEMATPEGNGTLTFLADIDGYNDASAFPERPVDAPEFEGF